MSTETSFCHRGRNRRDRHTSLGFGCTASGLLLFLTVQCATPNITALAQSPLSHKKVIAFGGGGPAGGVPDVAMFASRIEQMEQAIPVDGILVSINPTINGKYIYFADAWFGSQRFDRKNFQPLVDLLKTVHPKRFTDNFIRLDVNPGDVDWFDDAGWEAILNNLSIAASVAKEGNFRGIFLDTEQYGSGNGLAPLDYNCQKQKQQHSFDQYVQQAFRRGQAFAQTTARAYPGMRLLLTYGDSYVCYEIGWSGQLPLQRSSMNLLPAFVDGLLSVSPGIEVYDEFEGAYRLKTCEQFRDVRKKIKERAAFVSRDPNRYRRHIRAGYGLWIVGNENELSPKDYLKNAFTPREIEHALSYALDQSDGYVWLYLGGMPVFSDKFTLPQDYRAAIVNGRRPHPKNFAGDPRPVDPSVARRSDPPRRYVFEAEDLHPKLVEGQGKLAMADADIGLENWGQSGKMVTVVEGIYATGAVRFTFPAIPDGVYSLHVRVQYPYQKHTTTIQWRDGVTGGEARSVSSPGAGWTQVQFGDKAKGTWLDYGGWLWLELFGPHQPFRNHNYGAKQFASVRDGCYWVEIRDDNPLTYNLVQIDQFELERVE